MTQRMSDEEIRKVIFALEQYAIYNPGQREFVRHIKTGMEYVMGERTGNGAKAIEATLVWFQDNFGHRQS